MYTNARILFAVRKWLVYSASLGYLQIKRMQRVGGIKLSTRHRAIRTHKYC